MTQEPKIECEPRTKSNFIGPSVAQILDANMIISLKNFLLGAYIKCQDEEVLLIALNQLI